VQTFVIGIERKIVPALFYFALLNSKKKQVKKTN
jgi:hypothetical protein